MMADAAATTVLRQSKTRKPSRYLSADRFGKWGNSEALSLLPPLIPASMSNVSVE